MDSLNILGDLYGFYTDYFLDMGIVGMKSGRRSSRLDSIRGFYYSLFDIVYCYNGM